MVVSFALSVVVAFATGAAVLDKAYLAADRPVAGEAAISESEALVFRSDGDRIYGQVLKPNAALGKGRPVVIFCHGFAGFTRMDDVAQALCRAGCVATSHGFMGVRVAFAADVADFILAASSLQ